MSAFESLASHLYAEVPEFPVHAFEVRSWRILGRGIVVLEMTADFLTCAGGFLLAGWLGTVLQDASFLPSLRQIGLMSISAGLVAVLLLERDGAYHGSASLLHIRETERALRIPTLTLLCLLPLGGFFDFILYIHILLFALPILSLLFLLQKQLLFGAMRMVRANDPGADRVVIYGAACASRRIVSVLLQSVRLHMRPVAVIDEGSTVESNSVFELAYRRARSVPVFTGPINGTLLKACRCQLLIVAAANLSTPHMAAAELAACQAGIPIAFLSGAELQANFYFKKIHVDELSIFSPVPASEYCLYHFLKRTLDLSLASLLLIFLAPLLIVIALLIQVDSPGPALFVQKRVGRNGQAFDIYKFRSMFVDTPRYQRSPLSSRDPRITPVGRFLRRFSIDELPQLLNVLRGNMSLVGPRPEMPFIVTTYNMEQRQRLQVTPGITGLWQLSADRARPIHESPQYDLYYIHNRGFFLDVAVLVHTLLFAMRGGI